MSALFANYPFWGFPTKLNWRKWNKEKIAQMIMYTHLSVFRYCVGFIIKEMLEIIKVTDLSWSWYVYNYMIRDVRKRTYVHVRACSEDSDQPAHLRSLIRILTWRISDSQGCEVSSCGKWILIRLRMRAGRFESLLGIHVRRYVFTLCGLHDNALYNLLSTIFYLNIGTR